MNNTKAVAPVELSVIPRPAEPIGPVVVILPRAGAVEVELSRIERSADPAVVAEAIDRVNKELSRPNVLTTEEGQELQKSFYSRCIDKLSYALSGLDVAIRGQFRRSLELLGHIPTAQNEVLGQENALSDKTRALLNPMNLTDIVREQFTVLIDTYQAIKNASYKTLGFLGWIKRLVFSKCIEDKVMQAWKSLIKLKGSEDDRIAMKELLIPALKDSTKNQNETDCKLLSARITAFQHLRREIPGNWVAQFKDLQNEYARLVQNAKKNERKLSQLQVENLGAGRLPAIGRQLERLESDIDGYKKLYQGLKNKDFRLLKGLSVGRYLDDYDLRSLVLAADDTLQKIEKGQIGPDEKAFIKEIKRIAGVLPKFRSETINRFLEEQNSRPLEKVVKGMKAQDFDLEATVKQADATLKELFKNDTGGVAERQYLEKIEQLSQSIPGFTSPMIEQALDALRTLRQIEAINGGK